MKKSIKMSYLPQQLTNHFSRVTDYTFNDGNCRSTIEGTRNDFEE